MGCHPHQHLLLIIGLVLLYLLLIAALFFTTAHFKDDFSVSHFSRLLNPQKELLTNDSALEHLLPPRVQLNLSETFALVEAETSNLAALYYLHWKEMKEEEKEKRKNQSYKGKFEVIETQTTNAFCPKVHLPPPYQVKMNNLFWQVLTTRNESSVPKILTSYLLNAYYDDRLFGVPKVASIWVSSTQEPVKEQSWW